MAYEPKQPATIKANVGTDSDGYIKENATAGSKTVSLPILDADALANPDTRSDTSNKLNVFFVDFLGMFDVTVNTASTYINMTFNLEV